MNEIIIEKLDDYLKYKKKNNYIYRGVRNSNFIMTPSLYRSFIIDKENIDDSDIFTDNFGVEYNIEKLEDIIGRTL